MPELTARCRRALAPFVTTDIAVHLAFPAHRPRWVADRLTISMIRFLRNLALRTSASLGDNRC